MDVVDSYPHKNIFSVFYIYIIIITINDFLVQRVLPVYVIYVLLKSVITL